MEKRAKLRFRRMLFSPFASCKAHKLVSEVIHHGRQHEEEQMIPHSSTSLEPLLPPSSSVRRRPNYPSSMCKPRCPETLHEMVRESCILSVGNRTPSYDVVQGRGGWLRCPPASPASPPLTKQPLKLKHNQKTKKKTHFRIDKSDPSIYEEWFSSDDEREEDDDTESEIEEAGTLFSSSRSLISLSSSDPDSIGPTRTLNRRKPPSARRREARKKREALEEKVRGSFAVVKCSSDPYTDFRASMAEMVMENQIFKGRELEQLLHLFLSLNSPHHHGVILEVFADICDALFFD